MEQVWDAVVVGAGPAGCAAAYDLQAAGRRVLLLDRAAFPRPKACAGGLTRKAVRALRYSIAPAIRRWVDGVDLEGAGGEKVRVGRSAPVCAMTVREELDAFCLDRTRECGVEFRRVANLLSLDHDRNEVLLRFVGDQTLRSRFVIGADGVHSRVRAFATDGFWFRTGFAVEANVPFHPGEEHRFPLSFDFAPVQRGYGWLFPRNDHVNVGLYVEAAGERVGRAALDAYIDARCGPGRERSRTVGQFLGLGAAGYIPQQSSRVLLAGDAAGFVDPLTGEGIYGAIRSGQAAAAAVDAGLNGSETQAAYLKESEALRGDLRVAEHAASRFYMDPARAWPLLGWPLLPRLVLRAYADGLPLKRILAAARTVNRLRSAVG